MQTTRPTLGKYICGMLASLILLLAGGWLILAPFALGYQHYGADWTSQTVNDFTMGIPVAVIAFASFLLFFYTLLGSLHAAGMLVSRPRVQQQQAAAPVAYPTPTGPLQAPASNQSDLDRTLATLAAALAADLTARRQTTGSDQQSDQPIEPMINRREA